MSNYAKQELVIDGVRVEVLEAGRGSPIVYLHGAAAGPGFEELLPLAEGRRLIVPVHPGFGASDDDARIDSILDYVVHYSALFDQLGLAEPIDLVGHSLGGWISGLFTVLKGHRVRRLALACPAGLHVPGHPTTDLFTIPPENLQCTLVASPEILGRMASAVVTNEMRVARYREMTSLARIMWERDYEPKFDHWLPGVSVPALVLWGEEDHVIPVQQARHWADKLGGAETATFAGAGHLLFTESSDAVRRVAAFFARPT
jgi:pimeloyl-ACP methyl ester carboxylesterase